MRNKFITQIVLQLPNSIHTMKSALKKWRRYWGFRRFNKLGPQSSWGPRAPSHRKFMQENK